MYKKYEETGMKDIKKSRAETSWRNSFTRSAFVKSALRRSFAYYITSKIVYHPMTNSYLNRMVIHWFHRAQTIVPK